MLSLLPTLCLLPPCLQVEAALETARRVADAKEMAAVPHCSAEPTSLDVGTLEYGEVAEHTITLTNTAQAPSHFAFVPVPGTSQSLPGWLAANPSQVWYICHHDPRL